MRVQQKLKSSGKKMMNWKIRLHQVRESEKVNKQSHIMFPNISNLICAASEARQEAVRLQKENKDLLVELQMLKTRFKGKDPMLDNEVWHFQA
jgi:4-hydroxy-3-methylbut-2-enyl diphosphate reductase IspH